MSKQSKNSKVEQSEPNIEQEPETVTSGEAGMKMDNELVQAAAEMKKELLAMRLQMESMRNQIEENKNNTTAPSQQVIVAATPYDGKVTLSGTGAYDPDDILDEPVLFWTSTKGFGISGDSRHGIDRPHPYKKKINFTHFLTELIGKGIKGESQRPISKYLCYSKKEAEWLRGHSAFNAVIGFYEHAIGGEIKPTEEIQAQSEAVARINQMRPEFLLQTAKDKGVKLPMVNAEEAARNGLLVILTKEIAAENKKKKDAEMRKKMDLIEQAALASRM